MGFPPLISCEKTAPLHQSLQKSAPSFLGLQRLLGCAKISEYLYNICLISLQRTYSSKEFKEMPFILPEKTLLSEQGQSS
jgi:hypothetical protein